MLITIKLKKSRVGKSVFLFAILIGLFSFQTKGADFSVLNSVDLEGHLNRYHVLAVDTGMVYSVTEVKAEPKGGLRSFLQFIGTNFRYPDEAVSANVRGTASVTFVVEVDGRLTDVTPTSSIGYGIEEELVRVVRSSRKWKPGTVGGEPVRSKRAIPLTIRISY